MSIFARLQRASFRGIEFLLTNGDMEEGRKTVDFEYPNRSDRFVEDLGGLKRTFNVTGIISEPNYFSKRDALRKALSTPGIGKLVHPFYGTVDVVAKPYTVTEDMTRIGEATFGMTFKESAQPIFPTSSGDNLGLIADGNESLFSSVTSSISNIFSVSPGSKGNFLAAQDKLNGIASSVDDVTKPFLNVSTASSSFSNTLNNFKNSILSSIARPGLLAGSMNNLFASMSNITTSAFDSFKLSTAMFGFGSDDDVINTTTTSRVEKKRNNDLLNSSVNMYLLGNAYQEASLIDYVDENELSDVKSTLEQQFDFISDTSTLPSNTLDDLKSLRVNFSEFADQEQDNVFKIDEINIVDKSIAVLVYQYYGNLDNLNKILSLNSVKAPSRYTGVLKILVR